MSICMYVKNHNTLSISSGDIADQIQEFHWLRVFWAIS